VSGLFVLIDYENVQPAELGRLRRSRKRTTLLRTLHTTVFHDELSDAQVVAVLDELCRSGFVRVDGENVSYAPTPAAP
jgi:hypothetical protein